MKNKFSSNAGLSADQKGFSIAASLEGGKSFALNEHWRIEPQAQLTYQFIKYDSFNDGKHQINGYKVNDARLRLGSRLTYDFDQSKSVYAVASVVQRLTPATAVEIGTDRTALEINRTYGEFGLGGQLQFAKNFLVYSDVRLEKNFNKQDYSAVRGNLGLKYSF